MRARLPLAILFPVFLAEVQANNVQRQANSTPSSTASASSSSSSPALVFDRLSSNIFETCMSYTFTWTYNGPTLPLWLGVTNLGVPAPSAIFTDIRRATPTTTTSSASPTGTVVAEILKHLTDPNTGALTWAEINVPDGWYVLYGMIPSVAYIQASDMFYVESGSDTSCVLGVGGSSTATSNGSPSSSSGTGVVIPSNGSSSSFHTAMVGVIIGLLVIVAAIVAILFIRRRGKLRRATLLGSGGGRNGGARYGESKSVIFVGGVAGAAGAALRRQSMSSSVIPGDRTSPSRERPLSNEGAAQSTGRTINDPFDDSMTLGVVQDSGAPPQGAGAGAAAMSRTYSDRSVVSVSHSNFDSLAPSSRRPSVPDSYILPHWARRASMSTDRSWSSTYPPSAAYPSGTSAALSGGGGGPVITTQQPWYHYDPYNNIGASANSNRFSASSSGGHQPAVVARAVKAAQKGSKGARKTARKPVPAYTYDVLAATSADETSNIDDISLGLITHPESNYGYDNNASAGVIGDTQTQGHYMTRANSQPGTTTAKDGLAELSHKKSFGEKPIRVLIPDSMPLDVN